MNALAGLRRGTFRGLRARTVLLGVYGLFAYHFCLFMALRLAPPVETNLINYLWPLLMVLLTPLSGHAAGFALALAAAFYLWDRAVKEGDPRVLATLAYLTPLLSTTWLTLFGGGAPHAGVRRRRPDRGRGCRRKSLKLGVGRMTPGDLGRKTLSDPQGILYNNGMTINHATRGLIALILLASASGPCLAATASPDGFVSADTAEEFKMIKARATDMKAASAQQKKESDSAAQKDAVMVEGLASVVLAASSLSPRYMETQITAVGNLKAIYERTKDEGVQLRIVEILLVESVKKHTWDPSVPREGIRLSPALYAKALTASVQKTIIEDLRSTGLRTSAGNALNEIAMGKSN